MVDIIIDEIGLHIPEHLRYIDQFCTFDFESLLLTRQEEVSSTTQIVQVHKPVSFSIVSNIEGHTEPIFVADQNEEQLIDSFHDILSSIQQKYSSQRQSVYAPYLHMLQDKIDYWKPPEIKKVKSQVQVDEINADGDYDDVISECGETEECEPPSREFLEAMKRKNPWDNFINNLVENDEWCVEYNDEASQSIEEVNGNGENGETSNSCMNEQGVGESSDLTKVCSIEASEDVSSNQIFPFNDVTEGNDEIIENIEQLRVPRNLVKYQKIMYKKCLHLYEELTNFINRLSVIAFNSSKYDIKLIQFHLFLKFDTNTLKVIKKNGRFLSVTTPNYKFLDIINFLSPGSSYASFVRGFASDTSSVDENKLYFP